jgi:hypothetical protein
MDDTIEFYMVDEGIDENKDSICLQEAICRMIWVSAHAELKYAKEIDSCWGIYAMFRADSGGRKVLEFFQSVLNRNTDRLAEIYRNILAKNGPYQKLLYNIREKQRSRLKEIKNKFKYYTTQRENLEKVVKVNKDLLKNVKASLIELEGKLPKRSRLAIALKFARCGNKFESLNAQASLLRERIERTAAACDEEETKLRSLIHSKKETLQLMFEELKELDWNGYLVISDVISHYVMYTPRFESLHENKDSSAILHPFNIEEIHSQNWKEVEERARLRKERRVPGARIFIHDPSKRVQSNTDERTRTRPIPSQPSVCKEKQDPPPKNVPQVSIFDVYRRSSLVFKYPFPLTENPDSSVKTEKLPEDTTCRIPNPSTDGEFCIYGIKSSKE